MNEEDLMRQLSAALVSYASDVANGKGLTLYLPMLTGDSVSVTMTLKNNVLQVRAATQEDLEPKVVVEPAWTVEEPAEVTEVAVEEPVVKRRRRS